MKLKFSGKTFLIAVFLLVSLLLAGQVMALETRAQVSAPAIVNVSSLTVHATADSASAVVDVVGQNQVVTMLGRNSDASWVYVRTPNGILGWARPQSLTYTINLFDLPTVNVPGTTATPLPSSPTPVNPTYATGVVNTGALNVRSGPGVQFSVKTAVYFGDIVVLLGRNADATWVYIQTTNAVTGWVNQRYLTPSVPISSLPVVDASVSTPTPLPPGVTPLPTVIPPTPVTPVPTTIPNTAIVNTAHLNVRSGPGVGYVRVTAVDNGNLVSLLGRNLDTSWLNIRTNNGQQGWVNTRYLTTGTNVANLPVTAQSGTGAVAAGNLNIRSTPGASAGITTVASYGSALTLLGRTSDNTWLMVRANDGKEGWANAGYVSTAMTISLLPVLSGPVPGQPPVGAPPPVNTGNTTSLRSCPNLTCPVTGSVYSGLAVTATGRTADSTWVYVVLSNGQQGWIQAQYVALAVPITTLPILQ